MSLLTELHFHCIFIYNDFILLELHPLSGNMPNCETLRMECNMYKFQKDKFISPNGEAFHSIDRHA